MNNRDFLSFIHKNICIFDGAMGTEIYARGFFINRCYDELNITNPKLIRSIHQSYVDAGADVIETNTFGANRLKLKQYGLEDKTIEINRQGARTARDVAGETIFVAGSIGPLPQLVEPYGRISHAEAGEIFCEQAQALVDGGVDIILLETFSSLAMIQVAIESIKTALPHIPLIAQMTITEKNVQETGLMIAESLDRSQADIIGFNCSLGPKHMLEVLEIAAPYVSKPISVMPNAGMPQEVDGRNIYLASPDYFGEYAKHFAEAGAGIVGGCCGTNAEFIRQIRHYLGSVRPKQAKPVIHSNEGSSITPAVAMENKSPLAKKISSGEFVKMVEMTPPKGPNADKIIMQAKELKKAGIDAVNLPDGPRALARMSPGYLSVMIQEKAGMEALQHITCRDKNLLGMVSDLLGASAAGIHNLLIITGDSPKMGTGVESSGVFDVDSVGLTHLVKNLNHGVDMNGNYFPEPCSFFHGVGVNPDAIDLKEEIERLEKKVAAGAEFAITQPVFNTEKFLGFLKDTQHISIPIIAGIWPLASVKNAEFMNNEVPGVVIPQSIMQAMYNAKDKEEAKLTGIKIAREILATIKPHISGVAVSMPFGNTWYPLQVLAD